MILPIAVLFAIEMVGIGLAWAKHGERRDGVEIAWTTLIALAVTNGILWWGGWFTPLTR